jgi:transcriptional regulator with XRE-family HTH domain
MRPQEIGYQVRQARGARGLTQAQLATAAGVSRTTLNRLENGLFPDLGISKLQTLLGEVGLSLTIQPTQKSSAPDFIRMACVTANVSYRDALTEDQLIQALLTGIIPTGRRPHFRTLLEEAAPTVLQGLLKEAGRWTKPGRVEKNLAKIATAINPKRKPTEWLNLA